MPEVHPPVPDEAEEHLLELLRLRYVQNFTVSITCIDGGWTIMVQDPTGELAGRTTGHGSSFDEAWFGQKPA